MITLKYGNCGKTDGPWAQTLVAGETESKAFGKEQMGGLIQALSEDGIVSGVGILDFDLPALGRDERMPELLVFDPSAIILRETGVVYTLADIAACYIWPEGFSALPPVQQSQLVCTAFHQYGIKLGDVQYRPSERDLVTFGSYVIPSRKGLTEGVVNGIVEMGFGNGAKYSKPAVVSKNTPATEIGKQLCGLVSAVVDVDYESAGGIRKWRTVKLDEVNMATGKFYALDGQVRKTYNISNCFEVKRSTVEA